MKTSGQNSLHEALGFTWDRAAVRHDAVAHGVERAVWRFHYALPSYVWEAARLEGNPLEYVEVKTLVDGYAIGRGALGDVQQVLHIAEAFRELYRLVRAGEFRLDTRTADRMNLLTRRGEPPAYSPGTSLLRLHRDGTEAIAGLPDVFERALAYFLFGARWQFYPVTRPGQMRWQIPLIMMNGTLMSGGIDPVSIPVHRHEEFGDAMAGFRKTGDGTGMFAFLASCYDDWG
jgi:hypothetical protein